MKKYVRVAELTEALGISRTKLYRMIADEEKQFPQPVKIGGSTAFVLSEIEEWEARLERGVRKPLNR